ncbi:phage tail protein [Leclercia sp. W6]|nr:phage tail protein [Leclercia sp. W6]AXF61187.1 phage tail protein [Leclercia sp. W6]
MMAKFKTIITTAGAAKIAAVLAGTASIVLDNTAKMAVGDGGGTLPTPNPAQTKLVSEVHRAPINRASIDASDPKNIVAELVIPPDAGGFWVREMALYDAAGTLLAVGNMAETYKPSLSEGAGRKMVIRMVIAVSEVNAITITMDTSTVMATQDYVDSEIDKHAKSRNHPDATLTAKGFTQLSSSTTSTSETLAATPKAVKTVMDATNLKAPLASPALTGKPTAPTAAQTASDTQIATTAFVKAAIDALINSSPGALDTLGELAAALGNDPNFATTMVNALAAKAPLASPTLTGTPTAPTAAQTVSNTQIATTAFVKAAIAALVNSSPGALDTLSELAAALGNDPNFATTMVNALAAKAPLASPALTGKPTAPTAVQTSNDTQLATTEFVTRAVAPALMMRGALPASANLNNYGPVPDFIGIWSRSTNTNTTAAYNFPEDNGQGILEVIPGGLQGCAQRYTTGNGNIYIRPLTAAWNGTDGPWSGWQPAGKKPLNDLGLGLVIPGSSAQFDWQQYDFVTGQVIAASATNWINFPRSWLML